MKSDDAGGDFVGQSNTERIWRQELKRSNHLLIAHISDRLTVDVDQEQVKWRETDAIVVNIREYMTSIPMWADITWSWDRGVKLSLATYSLATYLLESPRGSSLASSPAR